VVPLPPTRRAARRGRTGTRSSEAPLTARGGRRSWRAQRTHAV
jgi:hypothetical protein